MDGPTHAALEATRRIRQSRAFQGLGTAERQALDGNLAAIERALAPDPFAAAFATPLDLQRQISGDSGGGSPQAQPPTEPSSPEVPTRAPAQRAAQRLGADTAQTLAAVDFSGFVAGLITGTFKAIVDATAEQMREFATLVSSLAQSVDDFSRDNVTPDQTRIWLAERYPVDLVVRPPRPGSREPGRLVPRPAANGSSPPWLQRFGLEGEQLSEEVTEGALLRAGRRSVAEERMQHLATMVLMGLNRIVVDQGQIRARLQFHARAEDRTQAEVKQMALGQKAGIAAQQTVLSQGATAMVSTLQANAQAAESLRADLMGEVNIQFRTETFPLERFADSPAIQLINRHARWQAPEAAGAAGTSAAPAGTAPTTPAPGGSGEVS